MKENRNKNRGRGNPEKKILAALVAVVILSVITAFCVSRGRQDGSESGTGRGGMVVDTRATDAQAGGQGTDPLLGRNIYFSGIGDATIGSTTVVRLDNREENLDFLMRYEVYDSATGELVFETELIPSGQHIDWVPGETLGAGEHTLDFLQIPYYPGPSGEYISLIQGSNRVTLAILD